MSYPSSFQPKGKQIVRSPMSHGYRPEHLAGRPKRPEYMPHYLEEMNEMMYKRGSKRLIDQEIDMENLDELEEEEEEITEEKVVLTEEHIELIKQCRKKWKETLARLNYCDKEQMKYKESMYKKIGFPANAIPLPTMKWEEYVTLTDWFFATFGIRFDYDDEGNPVVDKENWEFFLKVLNGEIELVE